MKRVRVSFSSRGFLIKIKLEQQKKNTCAGREFHQIQLCWLCAVCVSAKFTSDHSPDRQIGLHRSLKQVCLVSGFSLSSHALLLVPFVNVHTTLRFCTALFRVRQRDCKHSVHSPATQCGHSCPPHFSTVSGIESPAFSHKKLSTFCVALCKRTIQCAFRNYRNKLNRFI